MNNVQEVREMRTAEMELSIIREFENGHWRAV